jgi:hypothetical protein
MAEALRSLCQLVADTGVAEAAKMAAALGRCLQASAQVSIGESQLEAAVVGFSFANWATANGVWSNLRHTRLRRGLVAQSKSAVILATAKALRPGGDPSDVARLAANLEFDVFQPFAQRYTERMKVLHGAGTPFDSNAVLLFGLEWVQARLNITDAAMDSAMPALLPQLCVHQQAVEDVALQVNAAAEGRRRMGLLARFLEGWRLGGGDRY